MGSAHTCSALTTPTGLCLSLPILTLTRLRNHNHSPRPRCSFPRDSYPPARQRHITPTGFLFRKLAVVPVGECHFRIRGTRDHRHLGLAELHRHLDLAGQHQHLDRAGLRQHLDQAEQRHRAGTDKLIMSMRMCMTGMTSQS